MNPLFQSAIIILLHFLEIFFQLFFYAILAWIVCSWFIVFGAMTSQNKVYIFLGQMVGPILKPFRWAKIGPLDLSPIVAIWALQFIITNLSPLLINLIS